MQVGLYFCIFIYNLLKKIVMLKIILVMWELPQYLLGWMFVVVGMAFRLIVRRESAPYETGSRRPTVNYLIRRDGRLLGWSLGEQVFIWTLSEEEWTKQARPVVERTVRHEVCTHSNQSLYLGWFYLPIIALPSLIVTSISPSLAGRCYFEKILTRKDSV